MAKAEIFAGICGFKTVVEATKVGKEACALSITSDCPAIQRLAEQLTQVNPLEEISFAGSLPKTLQLGMIHCSHAACPVPVGIIKAVEVAAGLALPSEVTIKLSK